MIIIGGAVGVKFIADDRILQGDDVPGVGRNVEVEIAGGTFPLVGRYSIAPTPKSILSTWRSQFDGIEGLFH